MALMVVVKVRPWGLGLSPFKDSMKAQHGETWRGDWRGRLAAELASRGAPSLSALAAKAGWRTFSAMADGLRGPFAPIQMMMATRDEYLEQQDPNGFVADSLFRYLVEYIIAKPNDRERESQAASAFGAWAAAIGNENDEATVAVWKELKPRILSDWSPDNCDDETLQGALQRRRWRVAR